MKLIDLNSYKPKTVQDVVIGSNDSRATIDDIISGRRPFPSFGKNAILLYGIWGTGKTTLARLLPQAIEWTKSKKMLQVDEFVQCKQGSNGPEVMRKIENQSIFISPNSSNFHYFILDEVDNLTELAQASLKAAMNLQSTIFILTTNHIEKLDRGILNRCITLEMNAAPAEDWLPFAHRILNDYNITNIRDDELIPLIKSCKGSVRDIAESILTIASRKCILESATQ